MFMTIFAIKHEILNRKIIFNFQFSIKPILFWRKKRSIDIDRNLKSPLINKLIFNETFGKQFNDLVLRFDHV